MGRYTRAISGQRLCKHVPVARQQILNNAMVEQQQCKRSVSTWSVPRYYKQRTRSVDSQSRVEAGSNTSTVTLLVVGGEKKGSQESETVKYGHESRGSRTRK
jgi:hypothetical protein